MNQLLPLFYLFACLLSGMLLGKTRIFPTGKLMQLLMSGALYALLFFMGFRIGRNDQVAGNMATIGLLSLSFAAATVAGTSIVLFLVFLVTGRGRTADHEERKSREPVNGVTGLIPWHHFRGPLRLFAAVLLGFFIGLLRSVFPGLTGENISTWLLYLLILFIGIELSRSGINVRKVLAHPDTLILPVGTIVGSLAGGLVLSLFLEISPGKALALAAGFGWYSLSGVIITNLGDPMLGSAGFIANMLRETMALLAIPLIARTRYPLIGIGVAGATSMDVTLPLIERTCGPVSVPLAIASGAILSLLVPVLVPLFYQIG